MVMMMMMMMKMKMKMHINNIANRKGSGGHGLNISQMCSQSQKGVSNSKSVSFTINPTKTETTTTKQTTHPSPFYHLTHPPPQKKSLKPYGLNILHLLNIPVTPLKFIYFTHFLTDLQRAFSNGRPGQSWPKSKRQRRERANSQDLKANEVATRRKDVRQRLAASAIRGVS